jgi:membrane-bound lytic murein transglycosylase F
MFLKLFLFFLLVMSVACSDKTKRIQSQLGDKKELIVLTTESANSYYRDKKDGQSKGFDYELAKKFGDYLGVPVKFRVFSNGRQALYALGKGKGDIAVLGLEVQKEKDNNIYIGPPVVKTTPTGICQKNKKGLVGKKDTQSLHCHFKKSKKMKIGDKNFLAYPFQISDDIRFVWLLADKSWPLVESMREWSSYSDTILTMGLLNEKYFGYLGIFNKFDILVLRRRVETLLPKYMPYFYEAAEKYQLDPLYLAAMAYQESHWDHLAKSHTGVRGMMMLTQNTAKSLGVKDRLDPRESILGGAKYYVQLHKKIPGSVRDPDRDWYTLAAYNVGYGHLSDAILLAEDMGKNGDLWMHLKESLPLLSQEKYYRRLKYGYARGHEPVRYVQSIRSFYDHLLQFKNSERAPASLKAKKPKPKKEKP